jgi:hypothetical protein
MATTPIDGDEDGVVSSMHDDEVTWTPTSLPCSSSSASSDDSSSCAQGRIRRHRFLSLSIPRNTKYQFVTISGFMALLVGGVIVRNHHWYTCIMHVSHVVADWTPTHL